MSSDTSHDTPISHHMSTSEVIARLGDHGCENITHRLDLNSCGAYPLSNGGFGDVYRGKLLDGSHVAIKTMRIHVNTLETQKPFKNAARELHTWSKCRHPNVVQLLGLVEFRNQIGMVSYWVENGNLPSYLEKHPDVDRYKMSTEVSEGLAYLHAQHIVHGDLKGLNVLISEDGTSMLTDFGNAVLQNSTLPVTATTAKTTLSPRWAAPELLKGSMYSYSADVYALGMTILETFTGKVPYSDKLELAVYAALLFTKELPPRPEASIPSNRRSGNQLWSLLKSCWVHEPDSRPSADHVRDTMKAITQQALKFDSERHENIQDELLFMRRIGSTPLDNIISVLGDHGCQNITLDLDYSSCSDYPVGRDASGDTYQGKLLNGSQVAITTTRLFSHIETTQQMLVRAARELYTWSKCRHPHVLRLLGVVEFRGQIGMVSSWLEGGGLPSYLEKHPETDRCRMSVDICKGLAYLHASNIVHGNVQGINVLISHDGDAVLSGFVNAVWQDSTLQFTATTETRWSLRWMAPELIEENQGKEGTHSFAADVYALGMTILETLTGKVPYYGRTDPGVFAAVVIKKEPPLRPEDSIPTNSEDGNKLWSLLIACWAYKPENRPTVDDICSTNNILVSADGILKISDFDASVLLESAPDFSDTPPIRGGALRLMALESVFPGEDDDSPPVLRTKQTDIQYMLWE
ncbi:kinase-like protein [Ceratobasidium sp. AG-I]|nr:kinase-like protein [Ceratobasidium sp. AG-I]